MRSFSVNTVKIRRLVSTLASATCRRNPRLNDGYARISRSMLSSGNDAAHPARERMHYDVVTVGAGPAGLCAAIRLKQLAREKGTDVSVCVVEKGSEIGAHILSGNVFETRALTELFPNWKELGAPLETQVKRDKFIALLDEGRSFTVPNFLLPGQLHNEGNYIISLSQLVRWLGERAEELGVELYSGFAASEVLYSPDGKSVLGVATKDAGIAKDGSQKDTFAPGIELLARQTIFAEGCRGSCSEEVIERFQLRSPSSSSSSSSSSHGEGRERDVQSYGLGIKEVWSVPEENFDEGLVQHTVGWPIQEGPMSKTFGGTFLYHQRPNLVLLGMVVGLDYANPYLNPYKEFQRWKHHPEVSRHIRGGECVSYGARCLNEGGYHAIPRLSFKGGVLIGCSAGFLNAVKIKGTHTAMKSGMLAAEAMYPLLVEGDGTDTVASRGECDPSAEPIEAVGYEPSLESSWVAEELREVRNAHAAFHYGLLPGMVHTALSCFVTKGREPWTIANRVKDADKTQPASQFKEIDYSKPDNVLSFDLLTNLQRSGTNHDHDQPSHLRVKDACSHVPSDISIKKFAGPEQRFCPAGVYEYSEPDSTGCRKLVINAQNCVHCKCCSIKTPQEYIKWTVPEGGGGPSYTIM